jgi:hypothetical protein
MNAEKLPAEEVRSRRITVSLTPAQHVALRFYAARCRVPMSEVLMRLRAESLAQITEGGDPLGLLSEDADSPHRPDAPDRE